MFRGIFSTRLLFSLLSSRLIQVGLVFCVLIVGGAQWYSWHVHRTNQAKLERTNRTVQQLENKNGPSIAQGTTVLTDDETPQSLESLIISDETPVMFEEMDALPIGDIQLLDPGTDVFSPSDVVSDKEVQESPFGLGPYPEIPAGWYPDAFEGEMDIGHELIERVRIKLFTQGTFTYGGSISHKTGLVYPVTMDTVYVEFGTSIFPELGERRYIQSIMGHPTIVDQIKSNARSRDLAIPEDSRPMLAEDVPQGVQVLRKSDGIDPYMFLDLEIDN